MKSSPRESASFVHLDMARGLAALLVFLAHLRQLVFVPYNELSGRGPVETLVWGISGFGYEAVMIFFVLSGFFITRSIILDNKGIGFSWRVYLIKRLTRLWVVLIPCLIATFVWDRANILTGGALGDEDLGIAAFLKNGVFLVHGATGLSVNFVGYPGLLQMIAAPTYGSNGPLWSLTNEFWYYLLFPLLYLAAVRPRNGLTLAYIGVFVAGCAFIGESIVFYGIVWLFGAISCLIHYQGFMAPRLRGPLTLVAAIIALSAALAITKLHYFNEYGSNILVGLAAAPLILVVADRGASNAWYRRLASAVANASYTVYLAHFPFLLFLANVIVGKQRFANSTLGYAVFLGIGALVVVYCYVMYLLFEKHTGKIRRFCLAKLTKRVIAPVQAKATSVGLGTSQ